MRPERLMRIPCTITTRTQDDDVVDEYGNPTDVDSTDETLCWHHQGTGQTTGRYANEQTGLANVTEDTETFYWPPGTAVEATSSVTANGDTFEVAGPPWQVRHPRTGDVEYVMATAKKAG